MTYWDNPTKEVANKRDALDAANYLGEIPAMLNLARYYRADVSKFHKAEVYYNMAFEACREKTSWRSGSIVNYLPLVGECAWHMENLLRHKDMSKSLDFYSTWWRLSQGGNFNPKTSEFCRYPFVGHDFNTDEV